MTHSQLLCPECNGTNWKQVESEDADVQTFRCDNDDQCDVEISIVLS